MNRLSTLLIVAMLILPLTARAGNPTCNVKTEDDLAAALKVLILPKGGCGDNNSRTIFIDAPLTISTPIKVPNNAYIGSYDSSHPFTPQSIIASDTFKADNSPCMIEMGNNTGLANLHITTMVKQDAAVCIKGYATLIRTTIDGNGLNSFYRGIDVDAPAILIENNIAVLNIGILVGKSAAMVRNKIDTMLLGGSGIYFQALLTMTLNNELTGEGGIYFPAAAGSQFPLGVAANILKLNNVNYDKTNFFDIYKIFPSNLIKCNTPIGYNLYKEDGSCISYSFNNEAPVATCAQNQVKKPDGSCGCPDTMKLDPSGLCYMEKIVEKPVEKIIEKIIEKPVTGVATPLPAAPPLNPIVANPQGESSCSLVPDQVASALAPVGVFLMTIGLTGIVAYRSSLKTRRTRGKTKE